MSNSFSKTLNLKVNDYPILLGNELNESEMNSHGIKKVGFFQRFIIKKAAKNEVLFWSKNCVLKYLKEEMLYSIFPVLDTGAESNLMYGTSAYLRFRKNKLSQFTFQIIYNKNIAKMKLDDFEEKVLKFIGSPIIIESFIKIWESKEEKLICEFPHNIEYGYIHLLLKE